MISDIDKRRVNFCARRLVVVVGEIAYRARASEWKERLRERDREKEVFSLLSPDTNSDALTPLGSRSASRVLKQRSTCNDGDPAWYVNTRCNYQPGGPGRPRATKNFNAATRIIPTLFTQQIFAGKFISLVRIRDLIRDDDFESRCRFQFWIFSLSLSFSFWFSFASIMLRSLLHLRACVICIRDRWNARVASFRILAIIARDCRIQSVSPRTRTKLIMDDNY